MRRALVVLLAAISLLVMSGTALACGGLIGPNGAVNLLRTTTLAGWYKGQEHYVTAFQFAGGGGAFGSLVPLPGVPTKVERGGDWTLQRLVREVEPKRNTSGLALATVAAESARSARVLYETRIDALDITILEGGASEVGIWAKENGFRLPPDAPEVLEFYANRSPIFMAARFDADAALSRGQSIGDGTPIHLTIPTETPWVPLRILSLGKQPGEIVQADVFLLTPERPSLLPDGGRGLLVEKFRASESLLTDLRSDKGMEWIPDKMWLTYAKINAPASEITYDLTTAKSWSLPSGERAGVGWLDSVVLSAKPRMILWTLVLVISALIGVSRRRLSIKS